MDVEMEDADNTGPKKELCSAEWKRSLPDDAGDVRDISDQACWTLSSCKTDGFGIHQLLDESPDQYWQSDGPQPHTVTIEFSKKTDISFLLLYLDYKTDESYTPSKIVVHLGSSVLDLGEGIAVSFSEPIGWQLLSDRSTAFLGSTLWQRPGQTLARSTQDYRKVKRLNQQYVLESARFAKTDRSLSMQVIDLRRGDKQPSRAFVLQLQVVQNHQNGRDTHIRLIRVVGPARTRLETGVKTLIGAGTNLENVPFSFTSSKIAFAANIR